jgi:hypothetical protein
MNWQNSLLTALNVLGKLRPVAIVLIGTALLATLFAGNQLTGTTAAFKKWRALESQGAAKIKLTRKLLAKDEYERYGEVIGGLVPGVNVSVPDPGTTMRVAIRDVADYQLWVYALNNLQAYSKNVVWEAKSICLQECGNDSVAVADLEGYVQTTEFE